MTEEMPTNRPPFQQKGKRRVQAHGVCTVRVSDEQSPLGISLQPHIAVGSHAAGIGAQRRVALPSDRSGTRMPQHVHSTRQYSPGPQACLPQVTLCAEEVSLAGGLAPFLLSSLGGLGAPEHPMPGSATPICTSKMRTKASILEPDMPSRVVEV